MVKSPLNRELVATYEVTVSVIDNASDLPERSVSMPNGKAPQQASPISHSGLIKAGVQAGNRCRTGPGEEATGPRETWKVAAIVKPKMAQQQGIQSPELCMFMNPKAQHGKEAW